MTTTTTDATGSDYTSESPAVISVWMILILVMVLLMMCCVIVAAFFLVVIRRFACRTLPNRQGQVIDIDYAYREFQLARISTENRVLPLSSGFQQKVFKG